MNFLVLRSSALVIPDVRGYMTQVLPIGSCVRAIETSSPPHPLGLDDELYVEWVDIIGRPFNGWIRKATETTPAQRGRGRLLNVRTSELTLHPVDRLRDLVWSYRWREHESHWTFLSWWSTFGSRYLDELKAAIRELGGRVPADASADTVISRMLRLVLNKEVTVSEVTETAAATKTKSKTASAAKKSAAKKSSAKTAAKPAGRSMARTASVAAIAALEKAGAPKSAIALAKKLGSDEGLKKSQITELRDAINAAATSAREDNKSGVASQLSSVNKAIRRLARKA